MVYKICPVCNQTSYSASDRGFWNCPYCGKEMSMVEGAARECDLIMQARRKHKSGYIGFAPTEKRIR